METLDNFRIYASILKEEPSKEIATALSIPPPEQRQPDLQYLTSVFVSSGFNLNMAYFLPSELILSRNTIVHKPLDVEHEQEKVVGHLHSIAFAYKDGSVFDPEELTDTVGRDIDKISMDILASARLYKVRFPEVAEDVDAGKYGVSMECYFRDFDIIVNNIIIPKIEAKKAGLVEVVNNVIQVVEGKTSVGVHKVGRVLRGMLFSGCGLVEVPANPDSIILETAAKNNEPTNKYVLDLTKVDSYMKAKQENEAIVIHSLKGTEKDLAYLSSYGGIHSHDVGLEDNKTFDDGSHYHTILPDKLIKGHRVYFVSDGDHRHDFNSSTGVIGKEKGHIHKFYLEYEDVNGNYKVRVYETDGAVKVHSHEFARIDMDLSGNYDGKEVKGNYGTTTSGGVHYHELVLKDGTKLKTVTPQDILKMDSDSAAGKQNADGVDQKPEPEICVSFKRHTYVKGGDNPGEPSNADKTPGLIPQVESLPAPTGGGAGNTITQNDKIIHENWCALFETSCTVPAGQATHPKCLRLVLGRTTKDAVSVFFGKLEKERANKSLIKKINVLKKLIKEASKLY